MFIRFDRIHERDRHTHRQTPHDDTGRACIASRGNKMDYNEALTIRIYTLCLKQEAHLLQRPRDASCH